MEENILFLEPFQTDCDPCHALDCPHVAQCIKKLRAENESLKDKILRFGKHPAGFDWGILTQIDELQAENKRLKAAPKCFDVLPDFEQRSSDWGKL